MSTRRRWIVAGFGLIFFLGVTAGAAALGSWVTLPNIGRWYAHLRKPAWTPPNSVFGPVWTLLYTLMAIAAWRVWLRPASDDAKARRDALACWFVQLGLNVGWSWLFFGMHQPMLAFLEILALWLMILATIIGFAKVDRTAAALLVPYILWVTYAAALNGVISRMNS